MSTTFGAGKSGGWKVTSIPRVKGGTVPKVGAVSVLSSEATAQAAPPAHHFGGRSR